MRQPPPIANTFLAFLHLPPSPRQHLGRRVPLQYHIIDINQHRNKEKRFLLYCLLPPPTFSSVEFCLDVQKPVALV